jgi:hypothetical protein
MRRPVIAMLVAAVLVLGIIRLSHLGRGWLEQRQHYSIKLADLRCAVPPGMDRATFLGEVQYYGNLPDQISVLEPQVAARLAAAFALHPWVERVEGVNLRASDGPSVRLLIRMPALAVGSRVVDRLGVLLPTGTSGNGLPLYPGNAPAPKGLAGTPWGDAAVEAAARKAGEHN